MGNFFYRANIAHEHYGHFGANSAVYISVIEVYLFRKPPGVSGVRSKAWVWSEESLEVALYRAVHGGWPL